LTLALQVSVMQIIRTAVAMSKWLGTPLADAIDLHVRLGDLSDMAMDGSRSQGKKRGPMQITRRLFTLLLAALLSNSCSTLSGLLSTAQSEFDEGLVLFNGGKYQEAAAKFQKATEFDPNFGRAYLYLGRSYVNLKSWRQAIDPLRTAYRLIPDDTRGEVLSILVDALFAVGMDALTSGDFLSAIEFLREILGLQPTSAKARSELVKALVAHGGALLSSGNVTQAISQYTEAVKLAPNSFDAVFGLAKAFFQNGEFFKALQTAEDALRVNPANRDLQSLLQELRKK
jgi:tetratricopeptide (TPR) repeat protein